jgi:membrane peptidoglycan carboxypeptidase
MLDVPPDRIRPVMAMALGASEVSPLEQASGYCAFANGGFRPTRQLIRRIEDQEGRLLQEYSPHQVRVVRPDTAASMLSMLQTAVRSGTGTPARACGLPCGGKTGTTNSSRDVWFVGMTADLSVAVWIGNDNNSPMPRGSGSGFCAPAWARFVKNATEILGSKSEFPRGGGIEGEKSGEPSKEEEGKTITVCTDTGLLATPNCPVTKQVKLAKGAAMPGSCTLHGRRPEPENAATAPSSPSAGAVRVCAESGQLATPFCPSTVVRQVGPGQGPTSYCTVHGPGGFSGRRSGGSEKAGPERRDEGAGGAPRPPQPGAAGGTPGGPPEGQIEEPGGKQPGGGQPPDPGVKAGGSDTAGGGGGTPPAPDRPADKEGKAPDAGGKTDPPANGAQ